MEFDFVKYVFNKRRQGCSDKQIATSLGMSLKHFLSKLDEEEKPKSNPIIETFEKQMAETFIKPKKEKETEPEIMTEEVKEPVEES